MTTLVREVDTVARGLRVFLLSFRRTFPDTVEKLLIYQWRCHEARTVATQRGDGTAVHPRYINRRSLAAVMAAVRLSTPSF